MTKMKTSWSLDILMTTVSGENADAKDSNGFAPIHYAAYFGRLDFLKKLISLGANIDLYTTVNTPEKHSETPLILAVKKGRVEAVELMLKLGADQTLNADDGLSPLAYAIHHKSLAHELSCALTGNRASADSVEELISVPISANRILSDSQETSDDSSSFFLEELVGCFPLYEEDVF